MEKKIIDILNNFDFKRVHKAMIALEWYWYLVGGLGIPSVDTLKEEARRLLSEAWTKKSTCSSGGFYAEYYNGDVALRFVLEEF